MLYINSFSFSISYIDRCRTREDKTHADLAPVPSPRLNRINKLVTNKERASDKRFQIESEESAPIKSSSQGNEYT